MKLGLRRGIKMSFTWNKNRTGLVNLDKVRNLEIVQDEYGIAVVGWISDVESVSLGRFEDAKEATIFLESAVNGRSKNEK